jgi:ParB/RepB/Spo0J family partition protein
MERIDTMPPKKQKANYSALFNTRATLQPGAFPKMEGLSSVGLAEGDETQVQMLPLEALLDNPYQPRSAIDEEGLQQLTLTIQDQGFQGVLVARPHPTQPEAYQITAGHRRRDAARRVGLISLPVVVKDFTDQDMAILSVTENIQREDLTPLDEGKLYCIMMESMGMTLEQVAQAVKKSESYIRNRRRVAMAPADIQQMVARRPDSLRAVFYLLKVEDAEKRAPIIALLVQGKLTADEVDQYVKTLEQQAAEGTLVLQSEEASSPATPVDGRFSFPESSGRHTDGPPTQQQAEVIETPYHAAQEKTSPVTMEQSASELVVFEKHTIVGVSKLKTVLKAMKTYANARTKPLPLSAEEALLLDQIIEVVQHIRRAPLEQSEG